MTEDPKEIERQIDQTRNEMDETIDALSERLSVRHLSERATNAALRRAPMPPEGGRSFYLRRPFMVGTVAMAAGIGAGFVLSPPDTPERPRKARGDGQGIMQKAKHAYEDAKHQVKDKAQGFGETAKHAAQVTKDRTKDVAHRIGEESRDVKDEFKEGAREVGREMKEAGRDIKHETKQGASAVGQEMKEAGREIKHETKQGANVVGNEMKDARRDVQEETRKEAERQDLARRQERRPEKRDAF